MTKRFILLIAIVGLAAMVSAQSYPQSNPEQPNAAAPQNATNAPGQVADQHGAHVFERIRELQRAARNDCAAVQDLWALAESAKSSDSDGTRQRSERRPQQSRHPIDTAQERRVRGPT